MIIFEKHHQPFLFEKDNKIKIITSKLLNGYYEIFYGINSAKENRWKLYNIDYSTQNIDIIETPSTFLLDGVWYEVIAECNGYVYETSDNRLKLSYVVSVHNRDLNIPLILYFVDCDFDSCSLKTQNHNLLRSIKFNRTGIKTDKSTSVMHNDKLLIDGLEEVDLSLDFDYIVRLIGVWNQPNDFLVSGLYQNLYKTIMYNKKEKTKKSISFGENSNIYKSSVLKTTAGSFLAWTDKVFHDTSNINYFLKVSKIDHI